MRKRIITPTVIALVIAAFGFYLVKSQTLYLSHEAVVNATIADLLEDNNHRLPQQDTDLAMLNNDVSQSVARYQVSEWQVEAVELENMASIGQSLLDDDPIYGLKAHMRVAYEDGSEVTLSWHSWRYGIVLGSTVLSLGDGPPGHLVVAAPGSN